MITHNLRMLPLRQQLFQRIITVQLNRYTLQQLSYRRSRLVITQLAVNPNAAILGKASTCSYEQLHEQSNSLQGKVEDKAGGYLKVYETKTGYCSQAINRANLPIKRQLKLDKRKQVAATVNVNKAT
jgi:hypothetical protein